MKQLFYAFSCCHNPVVKQDSTILSQNSRSVNETQNNLNNNNPPSHNKSTQEEPIIEPERIKSNKALNSRANISNLSIELPQNHHLHHNKKNASNISLITVENIKIKESNSSLPEVDTEIIIGKELKLKGELFWNKEIVIDRLGMKSGKRKKMLNETVFGLIEAKNDLGRPVNDFIVNYPIGKGKEISLFFIHFMKSEELFSMTMMNSELAVNHLINYSYYISAYFEENFLIGKIFAKIKVNKEKKSLRVRIIDEKYEETEYNYKENDIPIVIGRVDANLIIPSSSISKNHAIIDYSDDMQAFFIQDLGSLNKTYKILSKGETLTIHNEMKFKLGETKFDICELYPK